VSPTTKGKPDKPKPEARMPLPAALVRELAAMVEGKKARDLIFTVPKRERGAGGIGTTWKIIGIRGWEKMDWRRASVEVGIDRRLYDLRHANIVRLIKSGISLREIAGKLDTSAAIIERHYARFIGDTSDDRFRKALPEYRHLSVVA